MVRLHPSETRSQFHRLNARNRAFSNEQVVAKFPDFAGQDAFIDKARRAATARSLLFEKLTQDRIIDLGNGTVNPKNYKKIADSNAKFSNDQVRKNTGDATLTDDEINAARCHANRNRTLLSDLDAAKVRVYAAKHAEHKERRRQNEQEGREGARLLMQLREAKQAAPAAPSATQEAQQEQNRMALNYLLN